ncbi:MAG: ankyrin repeat domain-containing protein [Chloracidobacterium sp.]|nr:ankyrin repeat domain-containing protein [Chloracidobacterium sp.]
MRLCRLATTAAIVVLCFAVFAKAQNGNVPDWIQREMFLRACENADIGKVKAYLAAGISPNSRDIFGQPAIIRAALGFDVFRNTPEVIRLLLKAGADVNATNEFGSTALFITVHDPESEMNPQALLLSSGADPKKKDKYGVTFSERKFEDDRLDESAEFAWRLLLEGRISWNAAWKSVRAMPRHSTSATSMMAASYYGIQFGRWSERGEAEWQREVDNNGENYLFYMASRTEIYVTDLLSIDRVAANTANNAGETALMRAARFDNDWLVKQILLAGAASDTRDKTGRTALEYAAEYGYFGSTFMLLARSDANLLNSAGRTPLMTAAEKGNNHAVRAYENAKAFAAGVAAKAPRLSKEDAKDALATARVFRRINVDLRDTKGMTALMLAAAAGHRNVVEALIRLKAKTRLRNFKGQTAADLATLNGHPEISKILK